MSPAPASVLIFLSTPSARRATPASIRSPMFFRFLSTPSARRATAGAVSVLLYPVISIHALREEGDSRRAWSWLCLSYFYPRPPRGGRPAISVPPYTSTVFLSTPSARRATSLVVVGELEGGISIHALREEGDAAISRRASASFSFLSTPSARRATAKTETKSLFSNKLYNILHEFRRALIYNGSKSYPNHAK